MLKIKNRVFEELTRIQKSSLLCCLKKFAKKFSCLDNTGLAEKFIKEHYYYSEVGNPYFEWINQYLDNEKFICDLKKYFKYLKYKLDEKEMNKPYIEKQKEYAKKKRKLAKQNVMSKQRCTKKQINYYKRLCKIYNIEKKEVEKLSKLDLKNLISDILEKCS